VAIPGRLGSVGLLLLAAAAGCGVRGGAPDNNLPSSAERMVAAPLRLSPEGEATLLALIDAGNLADSHWPDFADYRVPAKNFYDSVGHKLVWIRGTQATNQAVAVINLLQNADKKGLNAEDYDGPRWAERLALLQRASLQNSEPDLVRFDLALTLSAMRYASNLHIGRVNPHHVRFGFDIEHRKMDLAEFLRSNVVDASDAKTAFEQLEPPFAVYRRAQKALETYQKLAREDDAELLPDTKKPLEPGDTYPSIARLTRILQSVGDLPADAAISPDRMTYEGALVSAVKRFQRRHGLEPHGRIDRDTLKQMNTPFARRVEQLQLALERWRWLPPEFPSPPIVVNIPEFKLRAFNDQYKPLLTMKVVVGKAYRHRTPVFAQEMKYVIFRPYWDVPPSIQRTELVPEIEKDRGYITKHAYEIVDFRTRVVTESETGDLVQQLRSGQLALRQKPGANNALGLVKFVFPNKHDVYMHGTPALGLFAKSRRDFSHGCIRLENAEELAVWVLRSNSGWTRDHIRAAMNGNGAG
jgi:murein L,D-transpeptidase YcbB/YkuD